MLQASKSKLTVDISDPEPVVSDKSPLGSPRVTRAKTAMSLVDMELSVLFKFIKPYDGNRETLNSFLVNCDNAISLASEGQKNILFKYIISQLNGKAEIACSIKEFNSWDQLKEFLKCQFSERKHYSHLLTDLQENRQGLHDSVSQYALRTEACLSQLLTEVSVSNTKTKELAGRIAAMEDLALHHFVMGLQPRISNIIRCRSPKSLNEAINLAISEERIQQALYKRPDPKSINPNKFRAGPPRPNPNPSFSQRPPYPNQIPSPQGASSLICRYCKSPGHDISSCRKREYNNNRFRVQQNPNNRPHPNQYPRVNYLEQPYENEGCEEDNSDPSFQPPLNE